MYTNITTSKFVSHGYYELQPFLQNICFKIHSYEDKPGLCRCSFFFQENSSYTSIEILPNRLKNQVNGYGQIVLFCRDRERTLLVDLSAPTVTCFTEGSCHQGNLKSLLIHTITKDTFQMSLVPRRYIFEQYSPANVVVQKMYPCSVQNGRGNDGLVRQCGWLTGIVVVVYLPVGSILTTATATTITTNQKKLKRISAFIFLFFVFVYTSGVSRIYWLLTIELKEQLDYRASTEQQ